MQLADLTDFIAANQGRPISLIGYTLAVAAIVWGGFAFLHRRAGVLRSQEVKNAEREAKAAERLAAVYKAQLDDAEKRLKELAPQSQATDLAGLVDELKLRFTATARAWERLPANRLVHVDRDDRGTMVVRLADRALALEAHGYVAETFERGASVQVQRQGQFKLAFSPSARRIFLSEKGKPTESHDAPPGGIVQKVGTLGPDDVCLFEQGMAIGV